MRVHDLASLLKAPYEGDGETEVVSAAELESAGDGELAFVAARKFWKQAEVSGAACLIVNLDFPAAERTLIRAAHPRGLFARALHLLYPGRTHPAGVHPSAVVDASAILGDRVAIAAGCFVGKNVRIGSDSVLHPRVTLYEGVEIGERAILHSGCVIGADGFGFVLTESGYEKFPQVGTVRIGNDVEIGANSCIDRAALGVTVIGNGVKLDNMVHIAHNCRIGNHVVIAAQTGLSGGITVGDGAVIGGQVGIGDKARIEARAVLGSGCGVLPSKIVRAGEPVWGTPARPLKEYLEQLAHAARLPQTHRQLRQLQETVAAIAERLGLPIPDPTALDSSNAS